MDLRRSLLHVCVEDSALLIFRSLHTSTNRSWDSDGGAFTACTPQEQCSRNKLLVLKTREPLDLWEL